MREQQPRFNEAVIELLMCSHKASAQQGENVRLGTRLRNEEQLAYCRAMPLHEVNFESHRFAQSLPFALTQACSSFRDIWAAASYAALAGW